jgi:hypothetical protein
MEIKVVTYNDDGSISFEGKLSQGQVTFILQVGINFLLANGATDFLGEDEVSDTFEVPTSDVVQ